MIYIVHIDAIGAGVIEKLKDMGGKILVYCERYDVDEKDLAAFDLDGKVNCSRGYDTSGEIDWPSVVSAVEEQGGSPESDITIVSNRVIDWKLSVVKGVKFVWIIDLME